VLGIAIPPLVAMFRLVATHEAARTLQGVGLMYADSLMEEIASKSFEDPDESTGSFGREEGQRSLYDDVDDFDGLSNSPPTRLEGTLLDDYGGFRRRVEVVNVTAAEPDLVVPVIDGTTGVKRITVTVDWPGGEISLSTLRSLVESDDPGPLDEEDSAAGAGPDGDKMIRLPLINISGQDLLIESFSFDANVPTTLLKEFELDGNELYESGSGLSMPTGLISVTNVDDEDRTIPAGDSPELSIKFLTEPSGTITYTLVLNFTDGSSSTIVFTVSW